MKEMQSEKGITKNVTLTNEPVVHIYRGSVKYGFKEDGDLFVHEYLLKHYIETDGIEIQWIDNESRGRMTEADKASTGKEIVEAFEKKLNN